MDHPPHRNGADDYIVKTNFSRYELVRKLQTLTAQSCLPFEEPAKAEAPPLLKIPCPVPAGEPRARSSALWVENEWDPRLQGIIDHWE